MIITARLNVPCSRCKEPMALVILVDKKGRLPRKLRREKAVYFPPCKCGHRQVYWLSWYDRDLKDGRVQLATEDGVSGTISNHGVSTDASSLEGKRWEGGVIDDLDETPDFRGSLDDQDFFGSMPGCIDQRHHVGLRGEVPDHGDFDGTAGPLFSHPVPKPETDAEAFDRIRNEWNERVNATMVKHHTTIADAIKRVTAETERAVSKVNWQNLVNKERREAESHHVKFAEAEKTHICSDYNLINGGDITDEGSQRGCASGGDDHEE